MSRAELIIQEILTLPVAERFQVVEAVIHDLAGTSVAGSHPLPVRPKRSPIGWLADEPELADAILRSGTEGRARDTMRTFDDEDPR
jgi:hypothetical protein